MGGTGSGRKSLAKESFKEKTVEKAWTHVDQRLNDPNTPQDIKDELAKAICVKTAPQDPRGAGPAGSKIYLIGIPRKGEKPKAIEITAVREKEQLT